MTPREATLHHLKQLKGQPVKEQFSYILENFWLPIIAVLAAIVFLSSLVVHWATQKTNVLTLCCINAISSDEDTDAYLQRFATDQGIDPDQYTLRTERIYIGNDAETDYQYFQAFAAMQIAGDLDVAVAEYATIADFAYSGYFTDLTTALTQEQLTALSSYFLYIDQSLLEDAGNPTEEAPVYPDPTKPEEMEKPIPVAITLQPDWRFTTDCYPYTYEKSAIALFVNGNNADNATAFLQYILNGKG